MNVENVQTVLEVVAQLAVRHRIFGVGQIQDGSGRGPDRKLTVAFPGHGVKTIIARFVERVA